MTDDDVVESVLGWVRRTIASDAALAGEVESVAGADSSVFFVRLTGEALPDPWRRPLVLRAKPTPDRFAEAEREAAIQDWAADRGFPTPRVLTVLPPGPDGGVPVQVMERAPGAPLVDALRQRPWRARRALAALASCQSS